MIPFWKNDRILSIAFNVLIVILLLCIFLQCGIFLNRYADTRRGDASIPFDMQMLSASGQDQKRVLDADLLLPAVIAVSEGGNAQAILNSDAVMRDLYDALAEPLSACFSSEPFAWDASRWADTVTLPDVIYIRYHAPLPYQIIHAFLKVAADSEDRIRDPRSVSVSELCLVFENNEATVVVRGEDGVYAFRAPADQTVSEYASYARDYQEFFYFCTLSADASVNALTVEGRIASREIEAFGNTAVLIRSSETDSTEWLRRFRFNPDKLNHHTEVDGTEVYVETHGVMFFGADAVRYTSAEDGGIPLNEFCSVGQQADVYTYLRAASAWIAEVGAMDSRYTGGDAAPRLSSVHSDGEQVTLVFGLYADNLPVFLGETPARISMTFRGTSLTEMEWQTLLIIKQLDTKTAFFESWSRTVLGSPDVRLAYRVNSVGGTYAAEWIAYRTVKEALWDGIN